MSIVEELKQQIVPVLRSETERLATLFPAYEITFYDYDVGPPHLGAASLGIDCYFGPGPSAHWGGVALDITIEDALTVPLIFHAGVIWTAPAADTECAIIDDRTPLTRALIELLVRNLPSAVACLREAIRRGCPPSEGDRSAGS